MRFVITGGGTGGHIYPALAIARGLETKYKDCQILYIGTAAGLEAELVPGYGYTFHALHLSGLRRKLTLQNIRVLWQAGMGIIQARRVIKQFKPAVVIGTGGYVCGPVIIAAHSLGIPTMIHEQNALPGFTNRLLSRFTGQVAVTFEDSIERFSQRAKVKVTGLPVRPEIITANRESARTLFGVSNDQSLVFSFGGSQGARSINKVMAKVLKAFENRRDVKFLHVTGKGQYEDFMEYCRKEGMELSVINNNQDIRVLPYMHDMPNALAAADLVISRAGAATLAEITARGIPCILIPYPHASENHQEYNARSLVNRGAGEIILDNELNGMLLVEKLNTMLADKNNLEKISKASFAMGKPDALDDILSCLDKLIKK